MLPCWAVSQGKFSHRLEEAEAANPQVTRCGLRLDREDATHGCHGKLRCSKQLSAGPTLTKVGAVVINKGRKRPVLNVLADPDPNY